MKELVLSDPERCLLLECVFVVFRLSQEGFLFDHFPAEKLRDLCLKVDGVDLDAINDLFETHRLKSFEHGHFVDDPLNVVSVDPDFSCLGLNVDKVGHGN